MRVGELIKQTRARHRISQRSLALRAATDQAAISRIERGEVSPSVETAERLMAAMGESFELQATRPERTHDPLHVRALRRRPPAERLALAISWNRLAGRLADAGRQTRAG